MDLTDLFEGYELLVEKSDSAFNRMEKDYRNCIECEIHCSDCCHAIFGLFLIEAAFIQHHFLRLDRKRRREAILRASRSDKELRKIEEKLKIYEDDPHMKSFALSKERMRCPLLDQNEECILYPHRPITCRVYGIPTAIHGKAHVCGKAAFKSGESYPTFDLDTAYKELYQLSGALLQKAGQGDMERASLMISVSKAIKTPIQDIMMGKFD